MRFFFGWLVSWYRSRVGRKAFLLSMHFQASRPLETSHQRESDVQGLFGWSFGWVFVVGGGVVEKRAVKLQPLVLFRGACDGFIHCSVFKAPFFVLRPAQLEIWSGNKRGCGGGVSARQSQRNEEMKSPSSFHSHRP